jgi:hypothetical protein
MDQATAERIVARLDAIEHKLDRLIEFRDTVMAFATAGAAKRLAMLAKNKVTGGA